MIILQISSSSLLANIVLFFILNLWKCLMLKSRIQKEGGESLFAITSEQGKSYWHNIALTITLLCSFSYKKRIKCGSNLANFKKNNPYFECFLTEKELCAAIVLPFYISWWSEWKGRTNLLYCNWPLLSTWKENVCVVTVWNAISQQCCKLYADFSFRAVINLIQSEQLSST